MKAVRRREFGSSLNVLSPLPSWLCTICVLYVSSLNLANASDIPCNSASPDSPRMERGWERYVTDVSRDGAAKARIADFFVKTVTNDVAKTPGVSASIVDIAYYNRLAKIRGFKEISDDTHVAYLLYTHRGIHKSLRPQRSRHKTRWATVRALLDEMLTKRVFTVVLQDGTENSSLWCSRFDYEVVNLHDVTPNAYDEMEKLVLYMDLNRSTVSHKEHYDVMSLANATADIALLGYDRRSKHQRNVVVMVHRTRGSWIQISSLLTIQLLDQKESPFLYKLVKDMSVFKSCYEDLGQRLETIGFKDQDWRNVCVKPENLDNHALLTFEDYLWEFFNMDIKRLHPYQQAVLLILCGALHHALSKTDSLKRDGDIGPDLLKMYSTEAVAAPYLSVVKRMLSPKIVVSPLLSQLIKDRSITRMEYLLSIWLAYIKSMILVRTQLSTVNFSEYLQSQSPAPMFSTVHKTLLVSLACVTGISFFSALLMAMFRCCRRRRHNMVERQRNIMFGTNSEIEYESDTSINISTGETGEMRIQ